MSFCNVFSNFTLRKSKIAHQGLQIEHSLIHVFRKSFQDLPVNQHGCRNSWLSLGNDLQMFDLLYMYIISISLIIIVYMYIYILYLLFLVIILQASPWTSLSSFSLGLQNAGEEKGRKRKIAMVAVPAASDLLATALAAIGIMYIPASVWQMLRGEGRILVMAMGS